MKIELSSEQEIAESLRELPLWRQSGNAIVRELTAANFAAALGVVNAVAVIAEVLDHHPDILLYGWNKVRLTVSTHSKGGLTALDFEFAEKIEALCL